MLILMAIVIGALFAGGVYLLFQRSMVRLIIGLALLGHGTNLFLFTMGGLQRSIPPLVGFGPAGDMVDPVPQALILTAIVIGFGVTAFALVLSYKANQELGTDDLDEMRSTDA